MNYTPSSVVTTSDTPDHPGTCVYVSVCVFASPWALLIQPTRPASTDHPPPPPPPTSRPDFTTLQRKNWHRSLHSITWSHNSQSRTRGPVLFYTQRDESGGRKINSALGVSNDQCRAIIFLLICLFFLPVYSEMSSSALSLYCVHLAEFLCFLEAGFSALLPGICSLQRDSSSCALY